MEVKPKLIIAGPGAGKTYNMVQTIISTLPKLSASRYMAVITYTNSAANNIKNRLSKRITIPKNVYIGTIHSFLNKFIVIPFSSLNDNAVGSEKLFIQCDTDSVFEQLKKSNGKTYSVEAAAALKKKIKDRLNQKGYISFDQSIAIAKKCTENDTILNILANRIQYLFVDEFQDTDNTIFKIIDQIRKKKKTTIYCVGDPEQFIQSFDIVSKIFANIPIIKTSTNSKFNVELNTSNHRCSEEIVKFLNNFNARQFGSNTFVQESKTGYKGESVKYISKHSNAIDIITVFNGLCDKIGILPNDRCIVVKKNDMVTRVSTALSHNIKSPNKDLVGSPIKTITDSLLSALHMNQTEFCKKYNTDILTLRKHAIAVLKAIQNGTIQNENTYGKFITETLGLEVKSGIPIKVDSIRGFFTSRDSSDAITVSNIHNIKGLEAEAILAMAKTEDELLLWLETDRTVRESYRDKEKTDYPRLGYVAFSRAQKFLCIACLQQISATTKQKLKSFGVDIV